MRIHNSNAIQINKQTKYFQDRSRKSYGLWYSLNNEWSKWCKYEMPHWIKKYNYILNIDLNKILIIDTIDKWLEFWEKYKINIHRSTAYINWLEVSFIYDGFEINNYYKIKYDLIYHESSDNLYSWDVNSGCIWNLDCIKNIKKRRNYYLKYKKDKKYDIIVK